MRDIVSCRRSSTAGRPLKETRLRESQGAERNGLIRKLRLRGNRMRGDDEGRRMKADSLAEFRYTRAAWLGLAFDPSKPTG